MPLINIPTTGEVEVNDFRGAAGVANRDIRVRMSYLFNENGFGLNTQSSTDAPFTISPNANAIAWQPVFHAGLGFITSASITVGQNEDTAANTEHVLLYGGLTSSTVTNLIARWDAGFNGSTGGGRNYSLTWNNDGTINSMTYTGGAHNTGIITLHTDNISNGVAYQAGYKWFGFRAHNPSSFAKGGRVLSGTFSTQVQYHNQQNSQGVIDNGINYAPNQKSQGKQASYDPNPIQPTHHWFHKGVNVAL